MNNQAKVIMTYTEFRHEYLFGGVSPRFKNNNIYEIHKKYSSLDWDRIVTYEYKKYLASIK